MCLACMAVAVGGCSCERARARVCVCLSLSLSVCVCGQPIIHVRAQLFKVLVKKGGKAAVRDLAVPEKASLSTVK
eukprot:COSAG01_NODE_60615_length_293_cov_6.329897_1_plen_74_part_01